MIRIAIDGPGGAGKSSVAKLVAKELGIIYVDTGALYRSIGLYMLENGISIEDTASVVAALPRIDIRLRFTDRQILLLNGTDVGDRIRTPEVSMAASAVSAIPEVRTFLLDTQRKIAKKNSVIMDGRDIGTVILPNADLKIFLFASPEARAMRRYKELCAKGVETTYEDVLADMNLRDKNDSTRNVSPCVPAEDAFLLDNSELTLEGTAERICSLLSMALETKKTRKVYMRTHRWFASLLRFFFHVRVNGRENIPEKGGLLVCSNHIGARDIVLIGASFPRHIRCLAKKELFSVPLIGHIARSLGAISLNREGSDVGAIRKAVELARAGEAVMIFPQGHRYPGVSPADTQPKNGAALIARHAECSVLPVCIKTKKCKYALFRRVEIIFGKPIPFEELCFEKDAGNHYREASDQIFGHILALGDYRPAALEAGQKDA